MTTQLLAQQNIIVTGGASGIGKAIAKVFIEAGARLLIIDSQAEKGSASAKELACEFIHANVAEYEQAQRAIEQAITILGGLDVLVNNAGTGALASLHNYSIEQFDQLLKNNLYSVFYCSKAAIPHLCKQTSSRIVNIASETAERPTAGESPYSAAKAGVVALTKSTALEYGPAIRCNAISPGVINTPLTQGILAPELIQPMLDQCPLGRYGSAEEVANVALFLASDLSSYINGQNLIVDGGLSLPQAGINNVTAGITKLLEGN